MGLRINHALTAGKSNTLDPMVRLFTTHMIKNIYTTAIYKTNKYLRVLDQDGFNLNILKIDRFFNSGFTRIRSSIKTRQIQDMTKQYDITFTKMKER